MRIAICDDNVNYINYIIRLLKQIREIGNSVVTSYVDSSWLISDVEKRAEAFDVLITNTKVKGVNCVRVAKAILQYNDACQIIFITDSNELMPECYEVNHIYMLHKDRVPTHLVLAMHKAICNIEAMEPNYIAVTMNKEKLLLPCREILYFERVQRQTHIVLEKQTYVTYQTPLELIRQAGQGNFLQCHRSIYLNLNKVLGCGRDGFTLKNGAVLPIGRQFGKESKMAFARYSNSSVNY